MRIYIILTIVVIGIALLKSLWDRIVSKQGCYLLYVDGCHYAFTSINSGVLIGFFEWLINEKSLDPYSVGSMPYKKYKELVSIFAEISGDNRKAKRKIKKELLEAFIGSGLKQRFNYYIFTEKNRSTSMLDVYNRYYDRRGISYNCLILPSGNLIERKRYKKFVKNNWESLNSLSRDYLDIYYNESDSKKTGYDTAQYIKALPESVKLSPPSIVLWKESPETAQAISIRYLNEEQIHDVISTIVKSIAGKDSEEVIIRNANRKVEELQMGKSNCINNVIYGNNNSVVNQSPKAKVKHGDFKDNVFTNQIPNLFSEEDLEAAIGYVEQAEELSPEDKEGITSLLTNANVMNSKSEEEQSKIKEVLLETWEFLKTYAPKLFTKLAELATIAALIVQLMQNT